MATTSATLSLINMSLGRPTQMKKPISNYIVGLNSFGGLKAQSSVSIMGQSISTQQSFAKIVSSIRSSSSGRAGGAISATCNATGEIFRIAAIMNGLVLVGVAVGFVLLRIEAYVEEEAEA